MARGRSRDRHHGIGHNRGNGSQSNVSPLVSLILYPPHYSAAFLVSTLPNSFPFVVIGYFYRSIAKPYRPGSNTSRHFTYLSQTRSNKPKPPLVGQSNRAAEGLCFSRLHAPFSGSAELVHPWDMGLWASESRDLISQKHIVAYVSLSGCDY